MSLALIHDKDHIKNFWEKKIVAVGKHCETEEMRKSKSALRKSVPVVYAATNLTHALFSPPSPPLTC